jgi:hypothetical protein
LTFNRLQGVISEKTEVFITTSLWTSNPIWTPFIPIRQRKFIKLCCGSWPREYLVLRFRNFINQKWYMYIMSCSPPPPKW